MTWVRRPNTISRCSSKNRSSQLPHNKRRRSQISVVGRPCVGRSWTFTRRRSWTVAVVNPQYPQRATLRESLTSTTRRSIRSTRTANTLIRRRCKRIVIASGAIRAPPSHGASCNHRVSRGSDHQPRIVSCELPTPPRSLRNSMSRLHDQRGLVTVDPGFRQANLGASAICCRAGLGRRLRTKRAKLSTGTLRGQVEMSR